MPGPHTVVVTHREETKTEKVEAVPGTTVDVKPTFPPKALVPAADTRTRPTPPPPPPPAPGNVPHESPSVLAPPATTWPVYVTGAIGLGGLASAAIFGGLEANASHAVDVASQALVREGKSPAQCAQGIKGPDNDVKRYVDTCVTLQRNQLLQKTHASVLKTSLIVGVSGMVVAVAWFLLAPKERADSPASAGRLERPRLVPWVGVGTGGATFEAGF
jgi:hypothetical protein